MFAIMESMPWKVKRRERIDPEELQGVAAGSTYSKEKREVEEGHCSNMADAMRNEEELRNIFMKVVMSLRTMPAREPARKQKEATSLQDATGQRNNNKAAYTLLTLQYTALANGWGPIEKTGQLAAALEGEALQVLLDRSTEELSSNDDLATALKCRLGGVEPAVGLRQCLAIRYRKPGEKLSMLVADVRYLAWRGYPDFLSATQEDLAMEAFTRGLTPTALRQQVRIAAPTSLKLALAQAERVEAVLEESECSRTAGEAQTEETKPNRGPIVQPGEWCPSLSRSS
ncbi:hypothetical protein EOD39_6907 [Acipenser ruthenus]|uniref:Uncharacterized protein n=1 Tax=Acipenser ruthenus TaxID=7906 RepID=A0A662YZR6_ACIRT|nr:hypothetical protein EOD39_6907 [Acipenser ruthenus]